MFSNRLIFSSAQPECKILLLSKLFIVLSKRCIPLYSFVHCNFMQCHIRCWKAKFILSVKIICRFANQMHNNSPTDYPLIYLLVHPHQPICSLWHSWSGPFSASYCVNMFLSGSHVCSHIWESPATISFPTTVHFLTSCKIFPWFQCLFLINM